MTYRRIAALLLIAPAFALLLTLLACSPAKEPPAEQQRTWRPISQYVAAALDGNQEKCGALLQDWRDNEARFAAADVSHDDIDKVISVATKSTDNVRRLAILLLGEFHTYRANSTILELMNTASGDDLYACMDGVVSNCSDPRFGPQLLHMLEKNAAEGNDKGVIGSAIVLTSMGYGPAGPYVADVLRKLAQGEWWNDQDRLETMSRLAWGLGDIGYPGGAALYNDLLAQAAPHIFEEGKVESVWLRDAQWSFLQSGVIVGDKATVLLYAHILSMPGVGESESGSMPMGRRNLRDVVRDKMHSMVPWLIPGESWPEDWTYSDLDQDRDYKSFVNDSRTLYELYLDEMDYDPTWPWVPRDELRRLVYSKVEAVRPLLEHWLGDPDIPEALALRFSSYASRLGSWKGADQLLEIARGRGPFADSALRLLMDVTCSNCGRDWQAWESLIARMKKDLKLDVYTNSLQPLDAFEKLESPARVASTDAHV